MIRKDFCPNCFSENTKDNICKQCGYDSTNPGKPGEYLTPGTILVSKYMVGQVLGHGGFGVTYLGIDLAIQTKVAIKEYLPAGMAVRGLDTLTVTSYMGEKGRNYKHGLQRFIEEAKVLSKFNAVSSIVSIFDVFTANGTAYIVMEYLDGENLSKYVKRNAPLPYDQVLQFILPVCDALKKVHNAGIIHRDISLDNLYLLDNCQVKLLDFGAARLTLFDGEKSLSVILKPGYAPMEQYSRKGKQGPWTDIYALAATIYHMLTGQAPASATDRATGEELEFPDDMPKEIRKTLEKALSLRPEERYQVIPDLETELIKSNYRKAYKKTKTDKADLKVEIIEKNSQKEKQDFSQDFPLYDGKNSVNSKHVLKIKKKKHNGFLSRASIIILFIALYLMIFLVSNLINTLSGINSFYINNILIVMSLLDIYIISTILIIRRKRIKFYERLNTEVKSKE